MAYGNYNRGYNNNGNNGYQRQNNYGNNNGGGNYQRPEPAPEITPEEFISDRIAIHQVFNEQIKAQGLDPADFAFCLGGWVTSYFMAKKNGR